MMNKMCFVIVVFLLGIGFLQSGLGCMPYFPASFVNEEVGGGLGMKLAANRLEELRLIGEYYYPAWKGKAPAGNAIGSEEGHRLDWFAAARAAGVPEDTAEKEWAGYQAFKASVYDQCKRGRPPLIPRVGAPFQEFYLYTHGHAVFLAKPKNVEPKAWRQLVALPLEQRRYRTVWVRYVQVVNDKAFPAMDARLQQLRAALDEGCVDTLALEAAVLQRLLKVDDGRSLRSIPLVLAAAGWDDERYSEVFNAQYIWRQFRKDEKMVAHYKADPVGREIIAVFDPARFSGDVEEKSAILTADRQAWKAYARGDFELAKNLLARAPEHSLIRLWLEARFARAAGDYARSAELLRQWLARAEEMPDAPGGFTLMDNSYAVDQTFWQETTNDGGLARAVQGEFGVTQIYNRDYAEALFAFLKADAWLDAALVAERCMTTEHLIAFVDANPAHTKLRHLLARRLVREGRVADAAAYFPEALRAKAAQYAAFSKQANNTCLPADERALAFYNLGCLLGAYGMVLSGTELHPDNFGSIYSLADFDDVDEAYDREDHFRREAYFSYDMASLLTGDAGALTRYIPIKGRWVDGFITLREGNPGLHLDSGGRQIAIRWQYRARAAAFFSRAAFLAEDPDLKIASLWAAGTMLIAYPPEMAERYYQMMCDLRPDPLAEAANREHWFPRHGQDVMRKEVQTPPPRTLAEIQTRMQQLRTDANR